MVLLLLQCRRRRTVSLEKYVVKSSFVILFYLAFFTMFVIEISSFGSHIPSGVFLMLLVTITIELPFESFKLPTANQKSECRELRPLVHAMLK